MERTILHDVSALGQSIWLDNISRELTAPLSGFPGDTLSGSHTALGDLAAKGVAGVTTNPSIFEQAIAASHSYDDDIALMAREGKSAADIYEALTLKEVGAAADIMRGVYDETNGLDGFVSLEVNPLIASDKDTTVSEALRLFALLARPNVMIKIPATPEGIEALEECIANGVNVNSTLIFSAEQYARTAEAYIRGINRRAEKGLPLSVASVASVFVSRVDTAVDKLLADKEPSLAGKTACAGIKMTYRRFRDIFSGTAWAQLASRGARVQRPLWASTGTKDPNYSDVKYIEELIGPDTVNTVPPKTLGAFMDHGRAALTIESDAAGAEDTLKRVRGLGIDLDAVCAKLLADGLEAFNNAFRSLMRSIEDAMNR